MPAPSYLTRSELRELTGRRQRDAIAAWLKAQRWRYVVDADGWPKVARAFHDARLGLTDQPAPASVESEPDFSSLRRVA
jgi:hypothetical protein